MQIKYGTAGPYVCVCQTYVTFMKYASECSDMQWIMREL